MHERALRAGIDGCRGGWVRFLMDSDGRCDVTIFPDGRLYEAFARVDLTLIDIPIGLPWKPEHRECDRLARKLLGLPRSSGVFSPPCREALCAGSYREACAINYRVLGRGLSLQSWNIAPKIREMDGALSADGSLRERVRESHPELCFHALAGGRSMKYPKRTRAGFRERIETLTPFFPDAAATVEMAVRTLSGMGAARDDLLDALVLAMSAWWFGRYLKRVPEYPERDFYGLPMEITFPEVEIPGRVSRRDVTGEKRHDTTPIG